MKKGLLSSISTVFSHLAMVAYVFAHAAPAYADVSSYYVPPPPGLISPERSYYDNPAIILQNQANLNIYGAGGSDLGQLVPGTVFQTQVLQDPFHDVMTAPTYSMPDVLGTTMISPTSMGYMVPASLPETAMLSNGMTLPANSNFFIPPAEYTYQQMQIIGARSTYENADIDRLIDGILNDSSSSNYRDEDDEDRDSYRSSRSNHSYASKNYLNTYKPMMVADLVRAADPNGPAIDNTNNQNSQNFVDRYIPSSGPFRVSGPTCDCRAHGKSCTITGRFHEYRAAGRGLRAHYHAGYDIAGFPGTPIIAAADGYVDLVTDTGRKGYGKRIDIKHADNYMTRYADLSRIVVRPGQAVKRGDIIAYMGASGNSTGSHVHFETCRLQNPRATCNSSNVIDPAKFMTGNGYLNSEKQFNQSCSAVASVASQESSNSSYSRPRNASTSGRRRASR